jgi:protein TonB
MVKRNCIIFITLFFWNTVIVFGQKDTNIVREELIFSVDAMPFYKGGEKELIKFLKCQIQYPPSAISQKITGIVYIECLVDTTGITLNHTVLKGIRQDLDEEALRVARLVKFEEGARLGRKHVKVRYTIPVKF